MRPRSARVPAAALAVLLAAGGCSLFQDEPGPEEPARAFVAAWARGDTATAAAQTDDPAGARAGLDALRKGLGATSGTVTLGEVTSEGEDNAIARYTAEWVLPAVAAPWRYDGTLPLVRSDDAWTVQWGPNDLHPKLQTGQTVRVVRELPERAALQDAAGQPLFRREAVVTVGVEPRRVPDLPALATALAAALEIDPADVVADVRTAKPTAFVPVITLRRADYEKVKPRIYDLAGTVFQRGERLLGPSARFAQPLLGRVGEATAEVLKEAGEAYRTGDELGVSGLQRALNGQLTGTAGARVEAVWETPGNREPVALGQVEGKPGTPVRTTLDRSVQQAADAAVAASTTPTALVAVKPSTGAIVAVANNEKAPYDIALAGRFPPGSTFKIVTASALLTGGVVQPASAVDCPATTVVYGKRFQNSDRFELGRVPLREAFAQSCNTTFTQLSQRLDDGALAAAAAPYGVGSRWQLPVPSFGGSVPAPKDDTEKAADAIGQGRVEVSPLTMALVAASVAKGGGVVPSLVAGAEPAGAAPAGPPAAVLPALRDMMRAVVTEGTASALASLPGEVAGKTGTAEYGTAVPPRSHAWFAGYRGDLAFAVFVQDGQSSRTTAVPVARAFLAATR